MMTMLSDLFGWTVGTQDGELGRVTDCCFDDHQWTVRYFIVNSDRWLNLPRVLISLNSTTPADWIHCRLHVRLSLDQVRSGPRLPSPGPVSRSYEAAHARYFGYTPYWIESRRARPRPPERAFADVSDADEVPGRQSRLCSARDLKRCHVQGRDGEIGHVNDVLADDCTWQIHYLRVDTSHGIGNRFVLIPRDWVRRVDWANSNIGIDVSSRIVEGSQAFDPVHTR